VTTRCKIIGMISFVWENFVQNMVRIKNVREEIVSSQLRRRGIVGGIQTKPDSTSYTDASIRCL